MSSPPLKDRVADQAHSIAQMFRLGRERRLRMKTRHQSSPTLRKALAGDVAATMRYRGEGNLPATGIDLALQVARLSLVSDAFFAQTMYRTKVSLLKHGVPGLPHLCHRLALRTSQVSIGDPVIIQPGLYVPHGQIVVDGLTTIDGGALLAPNITIGLKAGDFTGPRLAGHVHVGTGARVLGPVTLGRNVTVGANAVVVDDIPAGATAVGAPARPTGVSAAAAAETA